MSVLEDVGSALLDFVAPELREMKGEIAGLRSELKTELGALRGQVKTRFDHLEMLLAIDARLTRVETMVAKEPPNNQ